MCILANMMLKLMTNLITAEFCSDLDYYYYCISFDVNPSRIYFLLYMYYLFISLPL